MACGADVLGRCEHLSDEVAMGQYEIIGDLSQHGCDNAHMLLGPARHPGQEICGALRGRCPAQRADCLAEIVTDDVIRESIERPIKKLSEVSQPPWHLQKPKPFVLVMPIADDGISPVAKPICLLQAMLRECHDQ